MSDETTRLEHWLKQNRLTLPTTPPKPVGDYASWKRESNIIYFSGFAARDENGAVIKGRLGEDMGIEMGREAAARSILSMLAYLKDICGGDWSQVKNILQLRVDIQCIPDFPYQPTIADGATELLEAIFGKEIGSPARTAIGAAANPKGTAVETTAVVAISNELAARLDKLEAARVPKR